MFPYLGPACNTLHVILLLYQNLVLLTNSQFCVGVCFSSQPKLHPHPPSLSKEEEEDTTTPPPHTCAIGHMQGTRTEVTVVPSSPLEKRTRPDILEQVIRLRPQEPSSPVSGGGKGRWATKALLGALESGGHGQGEEGEEEEAKGEG